MNKRYIIAAVLMVLGLILTAGAVSGSEYGDLSFKDSIVYGIVGAALLAATQKISLREATETLITAIYKSIPEREKENRP